MSLVIDITDAVVAELNANSFSQTFTAQRHYVPAFTLKELKTLTVPVVGKSRTKTFRDRNHTQKEIQVDIGMLKKLDSKDNAEIDPLMDLVEEISEFLERRRLAAFPAAVWMGDDNDPPYSPEFLEQHGQFASVLTLNYKFHG